MAKVVVVEDDGLLAKMYEKLLTFEQHSVIVASDGEQALPTITNEKPDIVLMDVMMPKMNGLQALEQLKKDPATAHIPIIVMSNLVNVNDPNEVMARGAARYVDKSMYDPKKISQLVQEVLSEKGQAAPTQVAAQVSNSVPAAAAEAPAPVDPQVQAPVGEQPVQSAPNATSSNPPNSAKATTDAQDTNNPQ